jgi:hypothetical protein
LGSWSKIQISHPVKPLHFENELTADIASYAVSGTPDYLTAQFAKVQTWARANRVKPWQILVGEYGVAQPSHNTLGDPLTTSPARFSAVLAAAHVMGCAAAVWDLDSGFGITRGQPGTAPLCPILRGGVSMKAGEHGVLGTGPIAFLIGANVSSRRGAAFARRKVDKDRLAADRNRRRISEAGRRRRRSPPPGQPPGSEAHA